MLTLLLQPRAIVSALLLVLQVLSLGHVALARHTLSETGSVVDVAPLTADAHEDEEGHLCAGEMAIHADAPDDCLVVAGFAAPSLLASAVSLGRTNAPLVSGISTPQLVAVQLDALSRAPKASPPQG
ncbi:MAG: hypothetical protein Q8N23_36200 [Archangium sp.]|nr:hypothetical protein [Archangium sp.]MDP3158171.1 hypothetical protein [Archangium sp.]MDP3574119.1 hypothetical protein [Archangium sp.]